MKNMGLFGLFRAPTQRKNHHSQRVNLNWIKTKREVEETEPPRGERKPKSLAIHGRVQISNLAARVICKKTAAS